MLDGDVAFVPDLIGSDRLVVVAIDADARPVAVAIDADAEGVSVLAFRG